MSARSNALRDLRVMIAAAILIRVPVVLLQYPGFPPGWGGEMASVAASLASGHGFSSPYWIPTGPTALVPPAYPFLLSLVFRLFGNHELLAGRIAIALGVAVSAAICAPVVRLGEELFDDRAGLLAGWAWALFPLSGWSDALFMWNTGLFGLTLTWFLVVTLGMKRDSTTREWIGLGALGGFLTIVEAAALPVVLWAFAMLLIRRTNWRRILTAFAIAAVLPGLWLLRNYRAFDEPVFLRSGLGLQLASGMREGEAVATTAPHTLPNRNKLELRRYAELGEVAYMQQRLAEGLKIVAEDRVAYLVNSANRAVAFWTGSSSVRTIFWFYDRYPRLKRILYAFPVFGAISGILLLWRRRRPEYWFLFLLLAAFPIPYYLTAVEFRYRIPLEPLLIALSAGSFSAVVPSLTARFGRIREG